MPIKSSNEFYPYSSTALQFMFVVRRAVTFSCWNMTNVVPCVCSGHWYFRWCWWDSLFGLGKFFFTPTDRQCKYTSHEILVAKRKACLQPEKTQGYQYLFAVQFFNSYVYRGRLAGLDKVFENWDRHHRIRRQILRKNDGLILILAQSWKFSFLAHRGSIRAI